MMGAISTHVTKTLLVSTVPSGLQLSLFFAYANAGYGFHTRTANQPVSGPADPESKFD